MRSLFQDYEHGIYSGPGHLLAFTDLAKKDVFPEQSDNFENVSMELLAHTEK